MMRQPLGDSGATSTRSKTLSAPVGGWNALDSIAEMSPKDAVFLDNFFPRTTDVVMRKGAQDFATLPAGTEIRSLMGYKPAAGAAKLFAGANNGVYEVTGGGAVAAPVVAATSGEWQYVNTTTPGGAFLVACNGQDSSMIYDGSQWIPHSPSGTPQTLTSLSAVGTLITAVTAAPHGLVTGTRVIMAGSAPVAFNGTFQVTVIDPITFTYNCLTAPDPALATVGSYTIAFPLTGSNITPSSVANISLFKSRIIMCVKGSLSFFYLPVNQLAGAASEFTLNAVFRKGGYLVACDTWTLDGGNGPDDYFVCITSEGELAVYKGIDPSNVSTFTLVGVFELAQPLGRRCFLKMASDTLVLTKQAVYPLSKSLSTDGLDKRVALSRKIERAWLDSAANAASHPSLYGWQPVLFAEASMLLVNVPLVNYPASNTIYSQQYVMNLMTGAWCRFTNWHSEVMLSFDGKLYFALHGNVYQGWSGQTDFGGSITASAKTAFTPLSTSRPKQIAMVRPFITADAAVDLQLGIDMDFVDNSFYSSVANYSQAVAHWDSAVWGQAVWNGSSSTLAKWRTVASRVGKYAAVRLRTSSQNVSITWIATDLLIADAGGEVM